MNISLSALVVWIIVGALAGTAAASAMGNRRRGGIFVNTIIGMIGALIGGFIFSALRIQIGTLAAIQINAQDLLAAFVGAVILIVLVRVLRRA